MSRAYHAIHFDNDEPVRIEPFGNKGNPTAISIGDAFCTVFFSEDQQEEVANYLSEIAAMLRLAADHRKSSAVCHPCCK